MPARVLLTGASGFLGNALVRALISAGVEVAATRRQSSRVERLADIAERLAFFDTSDEGLSAAIDFIGPKGAIIHAATCYGRAGESWSEICDTNIRFPLCLLEKALARSVRLFLNIDTILAPQTNAYALSKRQFADWGRLATAQYECFRFINVRLEHIYGPGDAPTTFVTQMIRRCLKHDAGISLTAGEQRRDFIYIDDAVNGLHTLLEAALANRLPNGWSEFDLGSGNAVSIRELVETIHCMSDSRAVLKFGALPYRENEVMESVADVSALRSLDWQCKTALKQGLRQTIDYEKNL